MEELFICQCENTEHQLIFREIEGDVYVSIHLKTDSFWKRFKNGVKYIFGHKSRYGDFDEFIFKNEDAYKLQKIVEQLKSKSNE